MKELCIWAKTYSIKIPMNFFYEIELLSYRRYQRTLKLSINFLIFNQYIKIFWLEFINLIWINFIIINAILINQNDFILSIFCIFLCFFFAFDRVKIHLIFLFLLKSENEAGSDKDAK